MWFCSLALMSVYLRQPLPLPDFTYWFLWGKNVTYVWMDRPSLCVRDYNGSSPRSMQWHSLHVDPPAEVSIGDPQCPKMQMSKVRAIEVFSGEGCWGPFVLFIQHWGKSWLRGSLLAWYADMLTIAGGYGVQWADGAIVAVGPACEARALKSSLGPGVQKAGLHWVTVVPRSEHGPPAESVAPVSRMQACLCGDVQGFNTSKVVV